MPDDLPGRCPLDLLAETINKFLFPDTHRGIFHNIHHVLHVVWGALHLTHLLLELLAVQLTHGKEDYFPDLSLKR